MYDEVKLKEIKAYIAKNPNAGRRAIMKACDLTEYEAKKALKEIKDDPKKPVARSSKKGLKSFKDFKNKFDKSTITANKVKDVLFALGDNWIEERNLLETAKISTNCLSKVRPLFQEYIVDVDGGKRVWAGRVPFAQLLRGDIDEDEFFKQG